MFFRILGEYIRLKLIAEEKGRRKGEGGGKESRRNLETVNEVRMRWETLGS